MQVEKLKPSGVAIIEATEAIALVLILAANYPVRVCSAWLLADPPSPDDVYERRSANGEERV